MKNEVPVAVTSRSFSSHPVLRGELLERYSNVRFNDGGLTLRDEALIEYVRGHRKAITALEKIDDSFLAAVPELEVISKYGVGTDMLDIDAMTRHGVQLGWTGGVNKRSVAELVVAFAIALLRNIPQANQGIRDGVWLKPEGRCVLGRTVGVIGCGHIGKELTRIVRALGCSVLSHDIMDFPEFYSEYEVDRVGLNDLLSRSDIVTLHVPWDTSTDNMLDAERLALMKPTTVLINTARGGLVDEHALKNMLNDGRLAGAAFDVFATEPPTDLELVRLPNFIATPHIGGGTEEAILAMGRAAIRGLDHNGLPSEIVKVLDTSEGL